MSSIKVVINTDENDDWIKRVHNGQATKQELKIHAEIAKQSGRGKDTDSTSDTKNDAEND